VINMDTTDIIDLWKEQDPELLDIDGLREFIEARASLNTIRIDKGMGQYAILTALTHLSKIGDISIILDDLEMLINISGNATGNFTVPIPATRLRQYEISEAIELTYIVSAKLLKMLTETKKNTDQIEINVNAKSIYIYAIFDNGVKFSYEIDINAEELSLRNATDITVPI